MNRLMLRQLITAVCLCSITAAQAQNADDPWFEIELIAFERGSLNSTLEKFNDSVTPIAVHRSLDLLKPLYQPDIRALQSALPWCQPDQTLPLDAESQFGAFVAQPWFDEIQLAEQSLQQFQNAFPPEPLQQWPLACQQAPRVPQGITPPQLLADNSDQLVAGPQVLPVIPALTAPLPIAHQSSPYLTDESTFLLKDLAWQLSHRAGHKLLLHTAWRQSLGVKRRSQSLRFFAGQRFSPQFDYQGLAKNPTAELPAEQADLQTAIAQTYQQLQQQQQLQQDTASKTVIGLPEQVWQLDGLVQPYNERMLFADTEFNLRQLVPATAGDKLQTFYVKDNVRLLLGEIHYLDHPRFGLILQIRRFTPPATPLAGEGVSP
ncbi:MAG: CsiV family protein [Rheinheimera sp.]|nr:CsiV family protein [Rheinheimera sp.]